MASLNQIKVQWSGTGIVGPAYSTFYCGGGGAYIGTALPALAAFFGAIKAYIPASVTITVPGTGQIYDDATGLLGGTWVQSAPGAVVGTGAGAFGAASGASVRWLTGAVVRRHLLTGRTFLVPLVASAFNANGVLAPATTSAINGAALTLVASGSLKIWSRPSASHPVGASAFIAGTSISNVDAILRSRRQ